MNCPRCDRTTDRSHYQCGTKHTMVATALICTDCLLDIEIRAATGMLMVYNNSDLPQTKGGHM